MSVPTSHRRPVERMRVAFGALGLIAMLGALVLIGEVLRHPDLPTGVNEGQLQGSDPRDAVECPQPLPREGQERDGDQPVAAIVDVTSNDLYSCPEFYDGERVRYRGEAVGALLHRDAGTWVQLNDDVYAELLGPLPAHRDYRGGNAGVGVLLPRALSAQISHIGGPQTRGDVLEIEGTFNRVDPSGEVAVIRADSAVVTTAGEPFPDRLLSDRRIVAIIAVLIAAATVVAERVVARRR